MSVMMRTTASSSSRSWIINCWYINFLIILFALYSLTPTAFSSYSTSTVNLSTTWTLKILTVDSYYVYDNSRDVTGIFNPILITKETKVKSRFALGFFCQGDGYSCTSHLLAIFILSEGYSSPPSPSPLVWSANRDHPVQTNATLDFTAAGELVLRDADATLVWTTNTPGKSVIGMNLTDAGNLVLYDSNNQVVWKSFDHPTDCLLPGQPLFQGQKLISSDSATNIQKGVCGYPLACGRNALCSQEKQCVCPVSNSPGIEYFRAVNSLEPNLGCSEITPLACNATQHQDFIVVENVTSITFTADLEDVNVTKCKQACLKNCSCKAAIFRYYNDSSGDCCLRSDLFTMATHSVMYQVMYQDTSMYLTMYEYYTAFIKVQNATAPSLSTSKKRVVKVVGPAIGISLIVVVGFVVFIVHKKRQYSETEEEEEYFHQVRGMPTQFSYGELKAATDNFSKKLGEGGFGTVFEGILEDGYKIAVKCLEGHGQVNKSFLAEVESIGSIHHVNLVRLRGYSAWKSQRLLVYDFMSNGSLDRWIYHGDLQGHVLEWECRKNIIHDIAKGLAYLHEECRQQIIHLDIKPQNILLDENFNAKVSDFGLSKLVEKNQTQVMTTIKGTPGYIAPECWSSSIITEKVDVYSFGIVVLEILCGRKIFDRSLPEESWHLLSVFQKSWEQGTLFSMVDKCSEDMQANGAEVVEMMKVASWCLQTEFTKRPSMSSVVKVLEGAMSVESNLDYNFTDFLRMQKIAIAEEEELTQLMPSLLSGPR
uniref:G-type lectin S-receptor-like serine/threonine-protein kinase SD2-5 n=1 Tax=Erigeron canadensis TaxID=72917 RepID=UPI001CB90103|nr:G-type lectin S-receptor-like serine/threonine-protein kinase SD2-5 [Erigeron canadensis]